MTPAETAKVLAAAAAFDQRTVGTSDVAAWHSALHDVDYEDARAAVVAHYRNSTERLMPMHIVRHTSITEAVRFETKTVLANAHDYVGRDSVCDVCGLPPTNRYHQADTA